MIKYYYDKDGDARARDELHPLLGAFLEQDVQNSPENCAFFLQAVDGVARGETAEWEGSGNAFTVTIKRDGVIIASLWDESLALDRLELTGFASSLRGWLEFITKEERGS